MTLLQLGIYVPAQADNDITEVDLLLALLNIIIMDINLNHSAKFLTIDDNTVDMTLDITTLTGIPTVYNSLLITGVTWKLQQRELSNDWTRYQAEYINSRSKTKHLVPSDYRLDSYNDIQYRNNITKWDIF